MRTKRKKVPVENAFNRWNPTMTDGVRSADGPTHKQRILAAGKLPKLRPMSIERLKAMGPPYTEEDQARLLYHELGSEEKVADKMRKPRSWTRKVLAYDIEQRKLSKTS